MDTLVSFNNLAGLYKRQGRLSEAEPLYQKALDGRREAEKLGGVGSSSGPRSRASKGWRSFARGRADTPRPSRFSGSQPFEAAPTHQISITLQIPKCQA